MTEPLTILLIEDHPGYIRLIREMLVEAQATTFTLEATHRLALGLERLAQPGIDVVLLDLTLPDSHGLETFVRLHAEVPDIPVIVLTGFDDDRLAIQAIQAGAQDYLSKEQTSGPLLVRTLRYTVGRWRGERERVQLLAQEQAARELIEATRRTQEDAVVLRAHELRATLAPLLAAAQALARPAAAAALDGIAAGPVLALLAAQARRLDALIAPLFQPAQMESLRARMQPGPVDLPALVRQVVAALRLARESPGFALTEGSAPPAVMGDAELLELALQSLLWQVGASSPPTSVIRVTVDRQEDHAQIEVRVPGRAPEIDLYLAREIVELHGGQVAVAGETVTLLLPLVPTTLA